MEKNRQGAKASYVALAVFIAAWVVLPSAFRRFNREAFAEFQAPALQLLSKGRDLSRYWELRSRSDEELISAARDLSRINAALELKLQGTDDIRRENSRLREMLRYPTSNEYLTVVARVISRDTSSWWQRIIIRKGRNDGIRPGAPVVFGNHVIGRISIVHQNVSEVDLITSPSFRCTAFLDGDEPPRIVHVGGMAGNSLSAPRAKISVIPHEYSPPAGEVTKVITTGLGGVFPAGLVIGTIVGEVTKTSEANFKEAFMAPSKDLDRIDEVSVLIPLHPSPGEILMLPSEFLKLEEFK